MFFVCSRSLTGNAGQPDARSCHRLFKVTARVARRRYQSRATSQFDIRGFPVTILAVTKARPLSENDEGWCSLPEDDVLARLSDTQPVALGIAPPIRGTMARPTAEPAVSPESPLRTRPRSWAARMSPSTYGPLYDRSMLSFAYPQSCTPQTQAHIPPSSSSVPIHS